MPSFPGEECTCDMDSKTIQCSTIVYRGEWLINLANLRGADKGAKLNVE